MAGGARMSGDPAWTIAAALHTGRGVPKRSGRFWMCRCPAHKDDNPSLSIGIVGPKIVYTCFGGCAFEAIADAVRRVGLDPFTGERWEGGRRAAGPARATEEGGRDQRLREMEEKFQREHRYDPLAHPSWPDDPRAFRAEAGYAAKRYLYRDGAGRPVMAVMRYDRLPGTEGGPRKNMMCLTPWVRVSTGDLIVIPRLSPAPRPLYGAETLGRPGTVIAVEGEKCRDALDGLLLGAVAVVSTYGSGMAGTDVSALAGRGVLVMPDHDGPGAAKAAAFLGAAAEAGFLAMEVPSPWSGDPGTGPPKGWDVADEIGAKAAPGWERPEPLTRLRFAAHLGRQGLRVMRPDLRRAIRGAEAAVRALRAGDGPQGVGEPGPQ